MLYNIPAPLLKPRTVRAPKSKSHLVRHKLATQHRGENGFYVIYVPHFNFEFRPRFWTYESKNRAPFLKPTAYKYTYIYIYIFIYFFFLFFSGFSLVSRISLESVCPLQGQNPPNREKMVSESKTPISCHPRKARSESKIPISIQGTTGKIVFTWNSWSQYVGPITVRGLGFFVAFGLWSGLPPQNSRTSKKLKWPKSDAGGLMPKRPKQDSKVTQKGPLLTCIAVLKGRELWQKPTIFITVCLPFASQCFWASAIHAISLVLKTSFPQKSAMLHTHTHKTTPALHTSASGEFFFSARSIVGQQGWQDISVLELQCSSVTRPKRFGESLSVKIKQPQVMDLDVTDLGFSGPRIPFCATGALWGHVTPFSWRIFVSI